MKDFIDAYLVITLTTVDAFVYFFFARQWQEFKRKGKVFLENLIKNEGT